MALGYGYLPQNFEVASYGERRVVNGKQFCTPALYAKRAARCIFSYARESWSTVLGPSGKICSIVRAPKIILRIMFGSPWMYDVPVCACAFLSHFILAPVFSTHLARCMFDVSARITHGAVNVFCPTFSPAALTCLSFYREKGWSVVYVLF